MTTVLIVGDYPGLAPDLAERLEKNGIATLDPAATAEEALRRVMETDVDLTLIQIDLGGNQSGIEAASYVSLVFNTPVVFVVRPGAEALCTLARIAEPAGFLTLPVSDDLLGAAIGEALASDIIFAGKARGPKPASRSGGGNGQTGCRKGAVPLFS